MSKKEFNPSGVGIKNGHFIGLPFSEKEAKVVLLSIPWDATVSFQEGTHSGPQNILDCSSQLDLFDADIPDAWKIGLYMRPSPEELIALNYQTRQHAKKHIDHLEIGAITTEIELKNLKTVNDSCEKLRVYVKNETEQLLKIGKKIGLIGGEHSIPLGYIQSLAERYPDFGILQIDAHFDLRKAYEDFTFSHASIFYNVSTLVPQVSKLIHVGIRDFCEEEVSFVHNSNKKHEAYYDQEMREFLFKGNSFDSLCEKIISNLPQHVYISFDIDGLDPSLCPNTGTPVPGGFSIQEAFYLIKKLMESGRELIGFDLSEVGAAGNDWDGNVGARVAYKLANWLGK